MLGFFKKPFTKLGTNLRALFSQPPDGAFLEKLEQLLYEADLGSSMVKELLDKLPSKDFIPFLKEEILKVFGETPPISFSSPHVVLIAGANGSGKTTTLAKLAFYYQSQKKSVLIAAGDTFRAAALQQLEVWALRFKIPLIKYQAHSDPSAVVFDALAAAKARKTDLVLIDTAGRLQTKKDLMQELAKMRTVCQKQIAGAPHETLLVLDATLGQNALAQARTFHQFVPLTGIVLTKLDGSAKGGIAIAIQKELKIPILWVGDGESEKDFAPFDPKSYVEVLLDH